MKLLKLRFPVIRPGQHLRGVIVLSLLLALVVISNLFFISPDGHAVASNDSTCAGCHRDIHESFIHTAHFHDSAPADSNSIKGSFEEGKNVFAFNAFMTVAMLKEGNTYRQSATVNGSEVQSANFDVVIGSGRNGQTYLYWANNQLFQLPVSYYRPAGVWCNSPGFPNYAFFNREIRPNCLECHTSYVKVLPSADNHFEFSRESMVFGITCSRCHPGSDQHAAYQLDHPGEKEAKYVVNPARLGRQLRMDACGLCHSGFRVALKPAFSFKVGDSLALYSIGKPVSQQGDTLDVHGNQVGLLTASKCYMSSPGMDCFTCHDVHKTQFNEPKLFSEKCVSCHDGLTGPACTVKVDKNIVLSDNCVDCHMPIRASRAITLNVANGGQFLPDYLRSHYIAVYPDAMASFVRKHSAARP
jgi:hypothetical protein